MKTANGLADGTKSFTFELRQGASTMADGTVLETKVVANTGTAVTFSTLLTADQHYQLCEQVFPGWNTTLGPNLFVPNSIIPPSLPNPNVNNLTVCTDFVAVSGGSQTPGDDTFTVDNTRLLAAGRSRSASGRTGRPARPRTARQKPILDQTLAAANVIGDATDGHSTLPGIVESATSGSYWQFGPTYYLVLHGSTATPNAAPDCTKAVRLLDKSTIDTNKKMASDPAFNLAAQLLAAELNFTAGAAKNGTVISAVNQAVLLLGKYKFDGKTHTKISAADTTTMNNLATILDNYNNNI